MSSLTNLRCKAPLTQLGCANHFCGCRQIWKARTSPSLEHTDYISHHSSKSIAPSTICDHWTTSVEVSLTNTPPIERTFQHLPKTATLPLKNRPAVIRGGSGGECQEARGSNFELEKRADTPFKTIFHTTELPFIFLLVVFDMKLELFEQI